jgi:hypothetical protein
MTTVNGHVFVVPTPHMDIPKATVFSNAQQHSALTLKSKRNHRSLQFLLRVGGQQRHPRKQENILPSRHGTTYLFTIDLKRWQKMAHTLNLLKPSGNFTHHQV